MGVYILRYTDLISKQASCTKDKFRPVDHITQSEFRLWLLEGFEIMYVPVSNVIQLTHLIAFLLFTTREHDHLILECKTLQHPHLNLLLSNA